MPHFHIHVYNRVGHVRDEEGQDLPSLAEAVRMAILGMRSVLSEEVTEGILDLRGRIEIASPEGTILRTIPFRDLLELHFDPEQG